MHTPGRTLGRYELIARIGEGGMAEVHLARQRGPKAFEKLVVVKTVHPTLASRPAIAEALLDEAKIAAKVKHPHVVDIYDLGEENGTYFIAMEYLEGESMTAIIRAQRVPGGQRLPPLRTARIVADCAAGLHAAHELRSLSGEPLELVHQDVTPGNVIVLYTGQAKLVDFGVAKVRTSADAGLVKGKAGYLAPELFDQQSADRRSDVFALGVVLWESLTLRRLFAGATEADTFAKIKACDVAAPSSLVLGVPPELDRICARALTRSRDERYPTAKAMRDELNDLLRGTDKGDYEPIAQFMRTTFAAQIAARQQLFKELDQGGAVEATTIEALATTFADGSKQPVPAPEPVAVAVTVPVPVPVPVTVAVAVPVSVTVTDAVSVTDSDADSGSVVARRPSRRFFVAAGAGVVGAAVVVALLVLGAGGKPRADQAAGSLADVSGDAPTPATVVAAPATVEPPIAIEPAPIVATPIVATPVVAMPIAATKPKLPEPRDPARAAALSQEGLQRFVRGDTRGAITSFQAALREDRGYAPAHRGLGLAYEKSGDRSRAARSFRSYLGLAPKARDAAQIRSRLEKL